jgi:chromosome segregation ATPase
MPVYDQVKQALQDILAPEIQALKAEIKRLDERISGLEEKMNARISGLEEKMSARISGLEEKMSARLSALEGKRMRAWKDSARKWSRKPSAWRRGYAALRKR